MSTTTAHDDLHRPSGEAVMITEMGGELPHNIAGVMLDHIATITNEMDVVIVVSGLPARCFVVAELRLASDADVGEQRQRSVHRRAVHRWIDGMHRFKDRLSRQVVGVVGQHVPYEASRGGDAQVVYSQHRFQVHDANSTTRPRACPSTGRACPSM